MLGTYCYVDTTYLIIKKQKKHPTKTTAERS